MVSSRLQGTIYFRFIHFPPFVGMGTISLATVSGW
jgi:hypothetical protein